MMNQQAMSGMFGGRSRSRGSSQSRNSQAMNAMFGRGPTSSSSSRNGGRMNSMGPMGPMGSVSFSMSTAGVPTSRGSEDVRSWSGNRSENWNEENEEDARPIDMAGTISCLLRCTLLLDYVEPSDVT